MLILFGESLRAMAVTLCIIACAFIIGQLILPPSLMVVLLIIALSCMSMKWFSYLKQLKYRGCVDQLVAAGFSIPLLLLYAMTHYVVLFLIMIGFWFLLKTFISL